MGLLLDMKMLGHEFQLRNGPSFGPQMGANQNQQKGTLNVTIVVKMDT